MSQFKLIDPATPNWVHGHTLGQIHSAHFSSLDIEQFNHAGLSKIDAAELIAQE